MAEQVSMTVLVIDDDVHIRAAIGKFLIARGAYGYRSGEWGEGCGRWWRARLWIL